MKQRIEVSQLQDLSPEQQDKLREWWKVEIGDCALIRDGYLGNGLSCLIDGYSEEYDSVHFISHDGFGSHPKEVYNPLLSIGQLIELLMDKKAYHLWLSQGEYYNFGHNVIMDWDSKTELIDCLFQAAKEIL